LAIEHTRPQAPHAVGVVLRLLSQPLAGFMSQSAKPALHVPMPHVPIVHAAVPLAGAEHARPHIPQWASVVLVFTSQPLAGFMSQSAKPALHEPTAHDPIEHTAVPLATEHARPHAPQFPVLALRSVSQPSSALPLQSAKPGLQVNEQVPVSHDTVALAREGHALPQRPQCMTLVLVLVSQPLSTIPSQLPKGAVHRAMAQRPSEHTGLPLAVMHWLPHVPQWSLLLCGLTQAPAQHRSPMAQRLSLVHPTTHIPPAQRCPVGQWVSVTHCSQVCVIVLQRGVAMIIAQPSSARHPETHAFDMGSQCWSGGQVSAVATHCTQAPVVVLQTAPSGCPMQSALLVQRLVHMFVIGLQMVPIIPAQSACERQVLEQSPVIGLQMAPAGLPVQSTLLRQGITHAPVIGLHNEPLGCPMQSALPVQRLVHMFVIGLQMSPPPCPMQSLWREQRMVQSPVAMSQMLPEGFPMQFALLVQGG
jgi:hypothetical protein